MGRQGKLKYKNKQAGEATSWESMKKDVTDATSSQKQGKGKQGNTFFKGKKKGKRVPQAKKYTEAQLEKRRAHTKLRRERLKKKNMQCFACRQKGHSISDCPEVNVGFCFKCGEADHTTHQCKVKTSKDNEYPFAVCFVCKQKGHLSRSCSENPKGLYPNGGCCKTCGAVDHFVRDCPENKRRKEGRKKIELTLATDGSADADDGWAIKAYGDEDDGVDAEFEDAASDSGALDEEEAERERKFGVGAGVVLQLGKKSTSGPAGNAASLARKRKGKKKVVKF